MDQKKSDVNKLIHVGFITIKQKGTRRLFLRKIDPIQYHWFEEGDNDNEVPTAICAANIEEAIRLGRNEWKQQSFRMLNCGFRYTLPERDEHGMNALFFQMAASYSASNGIYFDDELGHNCFIQAASIEARNLWKTLQKQNKI